MLCNCSVRVVPTGKLACPPEPEGMLTLIAPNAVLTTVSPDCSCPITVAVSCPCANCAATGIAAGTVTAAVVGAIEAAGVAVAAGEAGAAAPEVAAGTLVA